MILFAVTPMFFSVISAFARIISRFPFVIPAQAGIHVMQDRSKPMDSRLRGNDRVRA